VAIFLVSLFSGTALAQVQESFLQGEGTVPSSSSVESSPAKPKQDDPRNAWERNPRAFELHLAPFGSPVGAYGVTFDYALLPSVSAFAGLGSGGAGVQGAIGSRLRFPMGNHFGLGYAISLSGGRYEQLCLEVGGDCGLSLKSDFAVWNTHEVSAEYRADGGFLIRLEAGVSFLLNPSSLSQKRYSDTTRESVRPQSDTIPCVELVLGYAF
jgi:hypothetical protein